MVLICLSAATSTSCRMLKGVLNAVIGGWRVNGITTIRSGVPISSYQFFPGSALSQFGGGQGYFGAQGLWMRPDLVSGCNLKVSGSREVAQPMAGSTRPASSLWILPARSGSATRPETLIPFAWIT